MTESTKRMLRRKALRIEEVSVEIKERYAEVDRLQAAILKVVPLGSSVDYADGTVLRVSSSVNESGKVGKYTMVPCWKIILEKPDEG